MFVQYYTHVALPLSTVETRLDQLRSHLDEWAGVAYRDGEELFAEVGPGGGRYAKKVRLEIGVAEIRRAGVVYPITWTAAGGESLFPRLTADLILSHMGRDRTKLALQGTYTPPLGVIGRVVDRTLLKNVAESTLQDWVDRVATAISSNQPVS